MLIFMTLPATPVSAAVQEKLEGYTLESSPHWTTGAVKGWAEGECIPFRYTVANTGNDPVSLNLTLTFDHKHADGTIGIVGFENFVIPAGNITSPTLDGSGFYYWDVTVPGNTAHTLEWCARLSNEAGLWSGAKMHVSADGKDVPIQVSAIRMPDLYATKSANVTCDAISYTINYGNNGDADQSNTTLVDDYDESKVTVTDDGGGTDNGDTITWNIWSLAAGATDSKSYTVSIEEGVANGAAIGNTGNITGDLAEDKYTDNAYSVTSYAKVSPTASVTPDPAEVCLGVDLQLYGNPSGGSGTYTTHSWTGSGAIYLSKTNIENPVFNSPTLGTYGLTYTVTDANGCTGSGDVVVTVKKCAPDFTVDTYNYKAVNATTAEPGDTLSFTIYYKNTGNMDATNVTITDVVDANLEYVIPQDGGTYDGGTDTITWNIGPVAVNASGTVHFTADIVSPLDDGTIIYNTGTIDSDETEPEDTNTTETEVTSELIPTLDLTPESATNILPGDSSHEFTVTVKDQGGNPMTGQNVSLSTTFGTLSDAEVTTGGDGTATFTISSTTQGTATITATLGDLSDTATKIWRVPERPTGGGGGGCPSTKYLTVDWEGNNTTKPLYNNDKLAVDLLGPSFDLSHNLFLERGTHAPVVYKTTHYLIVVRELEEIPALPEDTTAIVVFNITPAGAEFNRDIFLTLGLDQSQLPENALNVTMAYYDDVNGVWVVLESEAGGPNGVAELTLSAPINHFSIFGVLAAIEPTPPPQPAHFVASGLNIEPSVERIWEPVTFVTKTGESVTITANVANDGGQGGTYTVELKLNGETVDTEIVTVGAGRSKQVSFTVSGLDYGQYEVEITGLSGEFTASRTITWWLIILMIVGIGLIIWGVVWGRSRRRARQQA